MNNCGDSIRVVHPLFQAGDDGSIPISPLQLEIEEINKNLAVALNNHWHSRLPEISNAQGGIYYAGFYCNRYYFTAIWTNPVAANRLDNGFRKLELRRMAISDDAPKNTASRALKVMRKRIKKLRPDLVSLISYQDTEVHLGTIYKAAGWRITNRQEKYVDWTTDKKTPETKKLDPNDFVFGESVKKKRIRREGQAKAPKIRWEFPL